MDKQVFFLAGIPRSGSTVLASLLNQNPSICVTQTSPILDMLQLITANWKPLSINVLNQSPDQLVNMLNGAFNSSYSHIDSKYIIDKHRSWPRNIDYINTITNKPVKVICTTRDISEIISSFIILFEKTENRSYIDNELIQANKPLNAATRARLLWEKYINMPWTSLKYGYEQHRDCIEFFDYTDIVSNPQETLQRVYSFLEIEYYPHHTFNNLSPMKENDIAWGIDGLHHIRPELKRVSPAASDILGKDLANYYNSLNLEFWKK